MGGYVPNPVTLSAAKVASYWLFGAVARRWASRFRSPLSFAILRGAAGALAGLVFLWVTVAANAVGSDARMYGSFQVLRVLVWAMVLHFWFRPRGGLPALALWTVLGTALSIAVDMLFWVLAQHSFPGATWTIC